MQRAIVVQFHYVVDHPKVNELFRRICLFVTLLEIRYLIILVAITQRWKRATVLQFHYVVDHPKVGE